VEQGPPDERNTPPGRRRTNGMPAVARLKVAATAFLAAAVWAGLYAVGLVAEMPAKALSIAGEAAQDGRWIMAGAATVAAYGVHVMPAASALYLVAAVQAALGRKTRLQRFLMPRLPEVAEMRDGGEGS
jgi:hypothetical protein